jgi:hypothetical protein
MRKATNLQEVPHYQAAPEQTVITGGWDNPTSKKGGM